MKFRVIVEQDEDGMFVAEVPSLPGCISQWKTRNEAFISGRVEVWASAVYLR
jgi:predicted RNase H-like HicB family nuclease